MLSDTNISMTPIINTEKKHRLYANSINQMKSSTSSAEISK